ncbi:MAG TPA: hypothetical protein PK727_01525 [Bacteroidales bacterium]|jgi:hypothetical protein|nr:hypothetical protein [Bacteroidales bacterium]MDI9552587.1 hypothetical protein [Bacteroidota bacterium]MBP7037823.1 hypothetical protein [Bacteroidales bacterium]MZP65674.1 hypothetical protein [Bacteroidales bacterium]NLK55619.1 hypothetical protein [Bacteroidales bacterium]
MPSVRKLKKNIDTLVFEVISDCFTFGTLHPDEKPEEVSGIITDAVSLRNDLIKRANNPSGSKDPKSTRLHFRTIEKDLWVGLDKLCGRLTALHDKAE